MSNNRGHPKASSDLHERRGRRRTATVILYSVAAVFLVAAFALMTQWLTSDPIGGSWLLASLLSVGGLTLLIASVRGAQVDDAAGRNYGTRLGASRPSGRT